MNDDALTWCVCELVSRGRVRWMITPARWADGRVLAVGSCDAMNAVATLFIQQDATK